MPLTRIMTINHPFITRDGHKFLPGATMHVIVEQEFMNGDLGVMTSFGFAMRIPAAAITLTDGQN